MNLGVELGGVKANEADIIWFALETRAMCSIMMRACGNLDTV